MPDAFCSMTTNSTLIVKIYEKDIYIIVNIHGILEKPLIQLLQRVNKIPLQLSNLQYAVKGNSLKTYHHIMARIILYLCYNSGVPSKNKSSCMNTLLSYEPFSVFQDKEEENRFFSLIANGLYLNIKNSVKLVF